MYGDAARTDDWALGVNGGSGVIWENEFYDFDDGAGVPPHKAIGFGVDDHTGAGDLYQVEKIQREELPDS